MYVYEIKNDFLKIGSSMAINKSNVGYIKNVDIRVDGPAIEGMFTSAERHALLQGNKFLVRPLTEEDTVVAVVATKTGDPSSFEYYFVPEGLIENNLEVEPSAIDDIKLLLTFAPVLTAEDVQSNLSPTFYITGKYSSDLELAKKIENIRKKYNISVKDVDEADMIEEDE